MARVLLLVLYALFWSALTVRLLNELLLVLAELLAETALSEVLYLGEVPLVLTFDLPRNAVEPLFTVL